MAQYLFHQNANAHWAFPTSAETDRVRYQAREAMADFLGGVAEEIVFGPNMTTLTYHLSRALGRALAPGDEIIVTELDHHANIDPWKALESERGIVVRTLPMDPDSGTLRLDLFPELLGPRTRLLAVGAASNALGTLTDVGSLARTARSAGARVFVDAVHLAPHRRIRVHDLACDFLACSPYKFYGPHAGVLWVRNEVLEELDVPRLSPAPDRGPERFESGTANAEAMAGTTAAVDFLASLAEPDSPAEEGTAPQERWNREARLDTLFDRVTEREDSLFRQLWNGLGSIPGVRRYGPPPGPARAPTLSFTLGRSRAREVSSQLADRFGTFLSHGDFYAATVVDRLGLGDRGLVRAGISIYTTREEVDRLVEGVAALARDCR
jgi:cysteine desulfurase family protein (TIGR01976 family)